jgi:hypothetical protein
MKKIENTFKKLIPIFAGSINIGLMLISELLIKHNANLRFIANH